MSKFDKPVIASEAWQSRNKPEDLLKTGLPRSLAAPRNDTIAIYIHWPFCKSKCPYCDFNSHVRESVDHASWLAAYLKEIDYFKEYIEGKYISSIFFGGGTPSLMDPSITAGIIDKLSNIGMLDSNSEITLEANPTSVEAEKFKAFKTAGVSRVSLGIQSFNERDLKFLGREHDKVEAIAAIELAARVFDRYSFDLIYARPNQTVDEWLLELEFASQLAADHISLYQLTIEKGTEFYRMYKDKEFYLPENELAESLYDATTGFLKSKGYDRYEISNYAKLDEESRHNLSYWRYQDYLGIGPGAHSRMSDGRNMRSMMMTHKPENWIKSVEELGHGIQTSEMLTPHEILTEILLMGLRIKEGVPSSILQKFFGKNIEDLVGIESLTALERTGLLKRDHDRTYLTEEGFKLHNYVLQKMDF